MKDIRDTKRCKAPGSMRRLRRTIPLGARGRVGQRMLWTPIVIKLSLRLNRHLVIARLRVSYTDMTCGERSPVERPSMFKVQVIVARLIHRLRCHILSCSDRLSFSLLFIRPVLAVYNPDSHGEGTESCLGQASNHPRGTGRGGGRSRALCLRPSFLPSAVYLTWLSPVRPRTWTLMVNKRHSKQQNLHGLVRNHLHGNRL
jgi:hypothetical protein